MVRESKLNFKVVIEKAEEGGYVAHVPNLPGCFTQGETMSEVTKNIKEAICLYLQPIDIFPPHKILPLF